MIRYILFFSLLLTSSYLQAQAKSEQGYYLVEPEQFSPPVQAMIQNFEGQPAEPFMANDVDGIEHYLPNYKGKKVILWFWTTDSQLATSQIAALNEVSAKHPDVKVISFAKQMSGQVREFKKTTTINFPIIANADVFGQMAYGAELGYPRYFLIDEYGIIKIVLPDQAFAGEGNVYPILKGIIGGM